LAVVCAVALSLRLYPALISGLPYSTDSWSSIRNTELLIQNTPVPLDSGLFDGYNNYWPGLSIFGAVFSEATGLAPVSAMAWMVPLAGALTIPLFFVLTRRITGNVKVALTAAALLAAVYPFVMSTAGATKEAFAAPIYISVLLIFLMTPSWKRLMLFSVFSAALVMSHHLTALLTIGVLAFLTLALYYNKNSRLQSSLKQNIGLLVVILGIAGGYFGFFALSGLPLIVSGGDLLAVGAYEVLLLSLAIFFVGRATVFSNKKLAAMYMAAVGLACGFMFFLTQKSLIAGAPSLPLHYVIYMVPYLVVLPLLIFGFAGLRERKNSFVVSLFWFASLAAFEGYAVFGGSPMGMMLAYRTLNFLVLPLFILAALVLWRLYSYGKFSGLGRLFGTGLVTVVLVTASVGSYSLYASVTLQEPYLGYFWLYREPEFSGAQWTAAYASNVSVAGDMKVSYLLKDYFNVPMDVAGGLQFLGGSGSKPALLFVYPEMSTNGYVVYSGNVAALPQNWTSKLYDLNQVYSNNMVNLYAK
jgi:hypothetical protein